MKALSNVEQFFELFRTETRSVALMRIRQLEIAKTSIENGKWHSIIILKDALLCDATEFIVPLELLLGVQRSNTRLGFSAIWFMEKKVSPNYCTEDGLVSRSGDLVIQLQ